MRTKACPLPMPEYSSVQSTSPGTLFSTVSFVSMSALLKAVGCVRATSIAQGVAGTLSPSVNKNLINKEA